MKRIQLISHNFWKSYNLISANIKHKKLQKCTQHSTAILQFRTSTFDSLETTKKEIK